MTWLKEAIVLLVSISAFVAAQGAGYTAQFSPATAGKAQGSVLVLDVSSLWKKHPTQPQISTTTASECQDRCARLPGCAAYSFCKDQAGCGSGCRAYVAKNPAASAESRENKVVPKRGERVEVESSLKLPISAFGPYHPNTASQGCDTQQPDRWAYGTCTLLKGTQPGKTASAAESAGWVSGWLQQSVPASCSGLSAAACASCASSPDPAACLRCMKDSRSGSYVVEVTLVADNQPDGSTGSRLLDQCVTCAQLTNAAEQKQCISCVLDNQACSSCVSYPGAATQLSPKALGPCMSCVADKGKRFTGTCLTCATSRAPSTCISCLAKFYPGLTCKTNEYKDCYKPDFDNPCATCLKVAPQAYDTCISCYSRPKSKQDCDNCAVMSGLTAQQQCFSCSGKVVGTNSNTPGGCGLCFTHSKNAATLSQCINCITGEATSAANRQHCSLCSSGELSEAQSARCFKCLAGKSGGPACHACSQTTSSEAAYNSCMACHSNSINGPDCRDCDMLGSSLSATARDALRKQCYECVTASKLVLPPNAGSAPLGSCQACLAGRVADSAQCVACNTNSLVPTVAKSWCINCAIKSSSEVATCIKCLASNKLTAADQVKAQCKL